MRYQDSDRLKKLSRKLNELSNMTGYISEGPFKVLRKENTLVILRDDVGFAVLPVSETLDLVEALITTMDRWGSMG